MKDVIVSIVTHNSESIIAECLRSLPAAFQRTSYAVIILDNASDDATLAQVQATTPEIELIRSTRRRGFGANQNDILCRSLDRARYVLILNDDVILEPGSGDTLAAFLDEHSEAGAVSPALSYPDGTPQVSGTTTLSIKYELVRRLRPGRLMSRRVKGALARSPGWLLRLLGPNVQGYLANHEPSTKPRLAGYLSGAAMLVRAEVLRQVGLFDETFRMYYEDTDWGRRACLAGWKLYALPTAHGVHVTGHSLGPFSLVERERSMLIYYAKYEHSPRGIAWLAAVNAAIFFLQFLLESIQALAFSERAEAHLARARACSQVVDLNLSYLRRRSV